MKYSWIIFPLLSFGQPDFLVVANIKELNKNYWKIIFQTIIVSYSFFAIWDDQLLDILKSIKNKRIIRLEFEWYVSSYGPHAHILCPTLL